MSEIITNMDEFKEVAKDYIVQTVARYSEVNGKNKACCPVHGEKTPSLQIYPNKGYSYCYGTCGKRYDSVGIVQAMENLDYISAVKKVASDIGFELQYSKLNKKNNYITLLQFKERTHIIKSTGNARLVPFGANIDTPETLRLSKDIRTLPTYLIKKLERLDVPVWFDSVNYRDIRMMNEWIVSLILEDVEVWVNGIEGIHWVVQNAPNDIRDNLLNRLSPILLDGYLL